MGPSLTRRRQRGWWWSGGKPWRGEDALNASAGRGAGHACGAPPAAARGPRGATPLDDVSLQPPPPLRAPPRLLPRLSVSPLLSTSVFTVSSPASGLSARHAGRSARILAGQAITLPAMHACRCALLLPLIRSRALSALDCAAMSSSQSEWHVPYLQVMKDVRLWPAPKGTFRFRHAASHREHLPLSADA